MNCPSCQREIHDASTFCQYCGTRIQVGSQSATQQSAHTISSTPSTVLGGNVVVSKPSTTPQPVPILPGMAPKPWYRSTGCLVLAFLFFTPLWSLLILTDKEAKSSVKFIAVIFLLLVGACWLLYFFSVVLNAITGNQSF